MQIFMALAAFTSINDLALNIFIAVIILLLGFVAGKIARKVIIKISSSVYRGNKRKNSLFWRRFASFISICVYILAVIFALERLGITFIVLKVLGVLVLIVLVGTLFFVLADFVLNFFYGLRLLTSDKIKKGDILKIKRIEGVVEKVGVSYTKLRTSSGDLFVFPNRYFFRNKFSRERK
ncbi:MAG: mechanosensitive ion channel domain-containing protein [Candidatus Nanoarchaeia archaeon]